MATKKKVNTSKLQEGIFRIWFHEIQWEIQSIPSRPDHRAGGSTMYSCVPFTCNQIKARNATAMIEDE